MLTYDNFLSPECAEADILVLKVIVSIFFKQPLKLNDNFGNLPITVLVFMKLIKILKALYV